MIHKAKSVDISMRIPPPRDTAWQSIPKSWWPGNEIRFYFGDEEDQKVKIVRSELTAKGDILVEGHLETKSLNIYG